MIFGRLLESKISKDSQRKSKKKNREFVKICKKII